MNLQVRASHSAKGKLPAGIQAAEVKAEGAAKMAFRASRSRHLEKPAEEDEKDSTQDTQNTELAQATVVAVAEAPAAEAQQPASALEGGADEKLENKEAPDAGAAAGSSVLPWILGGAAGIGLIAAASSGGGNGKGNQGNGAGNGTPAPAPAPADTSKPVFTSATVASVNENVAANSVVYKASATDNTGVKSYALAGMDAAAFTLDATTGEVRIKASPDFETKTSYTFDVTATDAAGNAASQTVRLNVNDLDDSAPLFDSANSASVNENSPVGQVVLTAHATDNAGAVTYALTGTDAAAFSIDAATGEVKLVVSPDFETKPDYAFNVVATDAAGNKATQAVTLHVSDLDEVAPVFTSGTNATVAENAAADSVVYTATATDNVGVVAYAISGTDAAAFTIDAATGEVRLTPSPDFETKASYSFTVTATDAAGNTATQGVTLGVTDVREGKSVLAAGDIAIVGMFADNPDKIAFLALEDIAVGTVINFTDNGWSSLTGAFRGGEGIWAWTATSVVLAGTVVSINNGSTSALTTTHGTVVRSGSGDLAGGGDSLIAYQGTASAPTLLYAVNDMGAHVWQPDATNSNTSALPTGLVEGNTAVALNDFDNTAYAGPLTGTKAELLAAIGNYQNWIGDNALPTAVPAAFDVVPDVILGSLAISRTTFNESRAYDGTIVETANVDLTGASFNAAVGEDLVASGKVVLTGVPAGLTAKLLVTDADTAVLQWTGAATQHANVNDIANISIEFKDAAFAGGGHANQFQGSKQSGLKLDFGDEQAAGSQQDFVPNAGTAFGSSDASTALAQNANWMIVGDDEHNVLRIYPRTGGAAVLEWNYGTALGLGTAELDLEGGTRIGDTLYFTGSHSNKKGGAEADNREFIFSVKMSGSGADTVFSDAHATTGLEAALVAWDTNNGHGLGAGHFGFAASSAGGVVPEAKNGFSIEGLSASLDGSQLLLGFRAPQADTTARNKALVVTIANADAMIAGAAPVFGQAIELDLGGRGIRSIERATDGSGYLILAGPSAGQTAATDDFQLYTWDGNATHAPVRLANSLDALLDTTGGSFETIVDVASLTAGTRIQLLQDNGDTIWTGQTAVSKDLAPADQHFVGNWISLGLPAGADTVAPTLVSMTPANAATQVQPNANLVLSFDENVVAGAGAFVIRDAANAVVETIAANSSKVVINGNTVTLNPDTTLAWGSGYTLTADSTALHDASGNNWQPSASVLQFTTAPQPTTTVLNAGDVLFLGINADATDAYAFVLMKDIVAGTQIGFTDRANSAATGIAASGESALMWTADKAYAAGTIVTITPDSTSGYADKGTLMGAGGGLSTSSETVYAFQGSIAGLGVGTAGAITVDRFLAGINGGTPEGDTPAELLAAGAFVDVALDNAIYSGSLDRSDLTAFATRVKNSANWVENDTVPQPLSASMSLFPENVTLISAIQGSGTVSAMNGAKRVLVEAMVTAVKPGMNGFFVQEEAADSDGNAATSEGVFVYYASRNPGITEQNVGDIVRFYADVTEYNNLTELTFVYNFQVVQDGSIANLPAPVEVRLPVATANDLEALEGMLVHIASATPGGELVVTDNFNLGRYGQVTLTSDALQLQFTETNAPDATAFAAFNAATRLDQIILDDGISTQNPATVWGRNGQPLSASNPLRAGDSVTGITGVLDQFTDASAGAHETSYRLQALDNASVLFSGDARPTAGDAWASMGAAPELKVVSANVLNLFTTLGTASFTTPYGNTQSGRGASNAAEYQRQLDKIVSELVALDADVYGLMEIQNNGFGDGTSAIDALVDAMNARAGGTVFAYVQGPFNNGTPGGAAAIGDDAITSAMVYKLATVQTVGQAATPDAALYDAFGASYGNRPPMAQTFMSKADGETFTVVVNHLKSKGSVNDPDIGDGQGANQVARERGAQQLVDWLATHPTGNADPDVLMIGDFNAYSKEDVVEYFDNHGFDKVSHGVSYAFEGLWGSLDHAFASDSLVSQVTGAVKWANNAQESTLLDYNLESKPAGNSYFSDDAYRASDHNPILIGLNLDSVLPGLTPAGSVVPQSGAMLQDTLGAELRAMSFDPTDFFRLDTHYAMPVL